MAKSSKEKPEEETIELQGFKYTKKEEDFCQAVLVEDSQSDAYRVAYDVKTATPKTVNESASKLMVKPKIKARVEELRDRVSKANDVTLERVMREQSRIAFSDIPEMLKHGGSLEDLQSLTADQRAAISGVEINTVRAEHGDDYETVKIKTNDKRAALDAITRMMGGYSKDNLQKATIVPLMPDLDNMDAADSNA